MRGPPRPAVRRVSGDTAAVAVPEMVARGPRLTGRGDRRRGRLKREKRQLVTNNRYNN